MKWFALHWLRFACSVLTQSMYIFPSSSFRYFEKRLHAAGESYKEEIALLQLKLVEGALEESVLKTTDDRLVS